MIFTHIFLTKHFNLLVLKFRLGLFNVKIKKTDCLIYIIYVNVQSVMLETFRIMEAQAEHQKTKMYNTIYTFTTSLGAGLLLLVLFWILHYRGGFAWHADVDKQFNWHPLCMILGMVFLYSQGEYKNSKSV